MHPPTTNPANPDPQASGMGKNVEALQRTFKFASILGGSEEIMADVGVRQALKFFPSNAKL